MADDDQIVTVDGVEHHFPAAATQDQILAALKGQTTQKAPGSGLGVMASALQTAKDVGTGVVKGAAHTAIDLGSLVSKIPGVSTAVDALYQTPGLSAQAFDQARKDTAYTNTAQTTGGVAEGVGEMLMPVGEGAKAVESFIPTAAKAGEKFQQVMAAAKDLPVDIEAPGQVALRINQLADRGASLPQVVRKFLGRITDPEKGPVNYAEARDFASNISRLSADEFNRLTPVVGREVANLRVALNQSIANTAAKAGKGAEYADAMSQYAQAMKIRGVFDSAIEGAKRGLPWITAAGVGGYLASKLTGILGSAKDSE